MMEQVVHFRKSTITYPDGEVKEEIHAIFACRKAVDKYLPKWKLIDCYTHNGQHGVCTVEWARGLPLATEEEYKPLYRELEDIVGYKLKVAA